MNVNDEGTLFPSLAAGGFIIVLQISRLPPPLVSRKALGL